VSQAIRHCGWLSSKSSEKRHDNFIRAHFKSLFNFFEFDLQLDREFEKASTCMKVN